MHIHPLSLRPVHVFALLSASSVDPTFAHDTILLSMLNYFSVGKQSQNPNILSKLEIPARTCLGKEDVWSSYNTMSLNDLPLKGFLSKY